MKIRYEYFSILDGWKSNGNREEGVGRPVTVNRPHFPVSTREIVEKVTEDNGVITREYIGIFKKGEFNEPI